MNNSNYYPYIGVTGIVSRYEACQVHKIFKAQCEKHIGPETQSGRNWPNLMSGFLVSSKTLAGQKNKYPHSYPLVETLSDIPLPAISDGYRALNLIHYNTDDVSTLVDDVNKMVSLSNSSLTGFQFNLSWPDPIILKAIKEQYSILAIVLQVGSAAIELVDGDPETLAEMIERYRHPDDPERFLFDGILLDPSGGFGKELNPSDLVDFADMADCCGVGIGVAGGLSAETIGLALPFIERNPNVSIDAQGKLRDEDRNLDLDKVEGYFDAALKLYSQNRALRR